MSEKVQVCLLMTDMQIIQRLKQHKCENQPVRAGWPSGKRLVTIISKM